MDYRRCPVCEMPAAVIQREALIGRTHLECVRCGNFVITDHAIMALSQPPALESRQVGAISYYLRRNAGMTIFEKDVPTLRTCLVPTVPEKMAHLLVAFGRKYPVPGENFMNPVYALHNLSHRLKLPSENYDWINAPGGDSGLKEAQLLGAAGLADSVEFEWLVDECLLKQRLLIEGAASGYVQIGPQGWIEITRLAEANPESKVGFVAMSFQLEFVQLYDEGIAPGISAAGYEPRRVDRTEHNNHIDDEMIALIKRSRFLVADFTLNRGGIYFEAGFAMGLGLPVIWAVREDRRDEVHFDTRQFNHIRWTQDKLPDLAAALRNRIEATIGRGPLQA